MASRRNELAFCLMAVALLVLTMPLSGQRVGDATDTGLIVPTRQVLRPAGVGVEFSGRPVDLAVGLDAKNVYVKDNRGLVVIDADRMTVRQELKFPADGGAKHGIALSRDGLRVYATGSRFALWEGNIGDDGRVAWGRAIDVSSGDPTTPAAKKKASYPCGVALSSDGNTAYVCLSVNNTLAVVDLHA